MRSLLLAFTTLLAIVSMRSPAIAQDNSAIIAQIKKEVAAIDKANGLEKFSVQIEGLPTDGGVEVTGFYKNGRLIKIVEWIGLSTGNSITEYYFKADKLLFAHSEFNSFPYDSAQNTMRHDTTQRTFEGRYYFDRDKLTEEVTTGKNTREYPNKNTETRLLREAEDNRTLLAGQRKSQR